MGYTTASLNHFHVLVILLRGFIYRPIYSVKYKTLGSYSYCNCPHNDPYPSFIILQYVRGCCTSYTLLPFVHSVHM